MATTGLYFAAILAAATDDEAARVHDCQADCECVEIDSGHDIHVEHPDDFVGAVGWIG